MKDWKGNMRKISCRKQAIISFHVYHIEHTSLIHYGQRVDNNAMYLLNAYYVLETA